MNTIGKGHPTNLFSSLSHISIMCQKFNHHRTSTVHRNIKDPHLFFRRRRRRGEGRLVDLAIRGLLDLGGGLGFLSHDCKRCVDLVIQRNVNFGRLKLSCARVSRRRSTTATSGSLQSDAWKQNVAHNLFKKKVGGEKKEKKASLLGKSRSKQGWIQKHLTLEIPIYLKSDLG